MAAARISRAKKYRAIGRHQLLSLPQLTQISEDQRIALLTVSAVLPFRVNSYIVEELIDWDDIPNDPIYQLTFPQAGMLEHRDFLKIQDLVVTDATKQELDQAVTEVRMRMNPHPAGQTDLNVPTFEGKPFTGCQHKYRETVLFFPSQGQTCHAFCTYCFRWPQLTGTEGLRFASAHADQLVRYLHVHPEVSDVLITGGDPMVMNANLLRRYIEPLLDPALSHVTSIRIGSKALAYWPFRFLTDPDTDELLGLLRRVNRRGRHLAFMAHFSHPRELQTGPVRLAIQRLLDTGATIRCQGPLVRHVNDDASTWAEMWRQQVRLGATPYYMFVERDTGPRHYFDVSLARALRIFSKAVNQVSGLARTVRGPSMSAAPGKVLIDGVTTLGGEKLFVLKMIQSRDPDWVNRIFFAKFDSQAVWLDQLEPPTGVTEHFFEPYLRAMYEGTWRPAWQRRHGARGQHLQAG